MSRRLRIVLVWLLTMAIPAYGMAFPAMQRCAPAVLSAAQAAAGPGGAAHTAHDVSEAAPAGAGHQHPPAATSACDADGVTHDHASAMCSACAPCTPILALPSGALVMAGSARTGAGFPPLQARAVEFVVAAPERPPRPLPA